MRLPASSAKRIEKPGPTMPVSVGLSALPAEALPARASARTIVTPAKTRIVGPYDSAGRMDCGDLRASQFGGEPLGQRGDDPAAQRSRVLVREGPFGRLEHE